jgi:hypothetical protein
MRQLFPSVACIVLVLCGFEVAQAAIDYHFVPAMNDQPVGYAQGAQIAPEFGPANFKVTVSGAQANMTPGNTPQQAHAYLGSWGLGVLNPQQGADKGYTGQVELDAKNGGEYIRMEFPAEVRLTYLIFASVGATDHFTMTADGTPVDMDLLFPNQSTILGISNSQGNWPGHIDFTKAHQPLGLAKRWDIFVTGGDGVQLENVGVVPEPSSLALSLVGLGVMGMSVTYRCRRKAGGTSA